MLADVILRYGYVLVFLAAAVEGDATLLAATFLAHRGYLRLDVVMVVAATATMAINQVYFWLARSYGRTHLIEMRQRQVYARVVGWIERYGLPLVFASRFIYGFRIAIPAACGATGMAPLRFMLGDAAGSVLWAGTVGVAGYAIGQVLERLLADLRVYEWWIALALLVGISAVVARYGRETPWLGELFARRTRDDR